VHSWGMPPVMFSVVTKYHKGRHSLFLYNSEIFYAFTQDILRSPFANQSELFKPTSKAELLTRTTTLYQNEQKKLTTILVKTHTAGSFTQLLTSLFTAFDRYGAYFLILERNQELYPTLLDLYKEYRQALYENTTRYLTTMSDNGLISALIQPKYDAAMIIDEIFWWSAHQEYDSFERGEHIFNKQLMRNAVISKLKRSYQEQLW
uniref:hypothetical protein n=1 Tax=Lactiplantibacillus paraplantarum TaxID=60520 RepID=UPI0020732995